MDGVNAEQEARLAELLREVKAEAYAPGWFGVVIVRIVVRDGVVQRASSVEARRVRW